MLYFDLQLNNYHLIVIITITRVIMTILHLLFLESHLSKQGQDNNM